MSLKSLKSGYITHIKVFFSLRVLAMHHLTCDLMGKQVCTKWHGGTTWCKSLSVLYGKNRRWDSVSVQSSKLANISLNGYNVYRCVAALPAATGCRSHTSSSISKKIRRFMTGAVNPSRYRIIWAENQAKILDQISLLVMRGKSGSSMTKRSGNMTKLENMSNWTNKSSLKTKRNYKLPK